MIELINDNVLIEQDEGDDISQGGIILPDTEFSHPFKGKVIAVGIGRLIEKTGIRIPMQCKVGDTVLFGAINKSDVEYEGKKYIMVSEQHLLGIVRE